MKEKSFKTNFIWNSIGSFTYLFCQWLLTFFVIRLSNNLEDAGNLSLAISITNIFFNIACFNLRPYLVSDNINEYRTEDYASFRVVTIVFSFIFCIIYSLMFKYNISQLICINLYMIYKIGEAIVDLFHAFEQRKSRMDIGGISLLIRGITSLIVFVVGIVLFHNINISIILMIVVTYLFIFTFDVKKVLIFENIKINLKNNKIKELFIKFLPLAIGTFLCTTATSIPRQVLEKIYGTDILGIYATIATPAVIVQVAASYIYNPLLVVFAKCKKNNDFKQFSKILMKSFGIMIIISAVFYVGALFLSELGLRILYGTEIAKYYNLFSIIIIYTSLTGFMLFSHNILIIFRKIKELLIIYLIGFLICIFSSNYLINKYSMNGVSYTLILFTLIVIILMFVVIYKCINEMKKRSNK